MSHTRHHTGTSDKLPTRPTQRHIQKFTAPLRQAALLLVAVITSVACGSAASDVTSPVTEEQALVMAENALEAFNTGDYDAWSSDWSDTMKGAIDEGAFVQFRDQFHAALGDYVSIAGATGAPGENPGFYRWTFDVVFEKADYRVWFGFADGSPLIEGVSFEDPAA